MSAQEGATMVTGRLPHGQIAKGSLQVEGSTSIHGVTVMSIMMGMARRKLPSVGKQGPGLLASQQNRKQHQAVTSKTSSLQASLTS